MIYFTSDVHLGLQYGEDSSVRERVFVDWLKSIENDCEELFLVGDIFDFWFEWNSVIPKGFVRVLGQLAKMTDAGIKINFFVGNHDKWAVDYFSKELGINTFHKEHIFERNGKRFLVVHGDGLGKSDWVGRTLNRLFNSKNARWMFQRFIHPDASMRFGKWWSGSNRHSRGNIGHQFRFENEPISIWAKNQLETTYANSTIDYIVIGHLHTPVIYDIGETKLTILGEWIEKRTYATMNENGEITLHGFKPNTQTSL